MEEQRILLRPTKRFLLAQRVNHVIPAVMLLLSAAERLAGGHHGSPWLIALDVIAAGGLLAVLVREMRSAAATSHSRVGLFEIFAGVVVGLEAAHRFNAAKGFQPAVLYFVVALVTILTGVFHHRITSAVRADFTREGFSIRTRPFRAFRMAWSDVAAIGRRGDRLVVTSTAARRSRINLRTCANRDEVIAAFERHFAAYRAGPVAEPPAAD